MRKLIILLLFCAFALIAAKKFINWVNEPTAEEVRDFTRKSLNLWEETHSTPAMVRPKRPKHG